jgi:Prion-inhibition and propagation
MPGLEVVGLTASAVALAALFSTCIECFEYFRAGQSLEPDLDTVLAKLDIEKTRLLIWGNHIGILNATTEGRHAALQNEQILGSLRSCLKQIESLLSSTEQLGLKYGMRDAGPTERTRSPTPVLSKNGMGIFRASCVRFLAQIPSKSNRPGLATRTKWAIVDKTRFQGLVHDLKDFIDGLNQILPVDRHIQDQIAMADIESITDLGGLRLIQEASEHSYPAWSSKASEVIEASELGTVDRRNLEERIRDMQESPIVYSTNGQLSIHQQPASKLKGQSAPKSFDSNLANSRTAVANSGSILIVVTDKCGHHTGSLCEDSSFAKSVFVPKNHSSVARSDLTWNLGRRLTDCLDWPSLLQSEDHSKVLQNCRPDQTAETSTYKLPKAYRKIAKMFILCPPCLCQLHTALLICLGAEVSPLLEFCIRIDDRLPSSCCRGGQPSERLKSFDQRIKYLEGRMTAAKAVPIQAANNIGRIDCPWLEKRIFRVEGDLIEPLFAEDPSAIVSDMLADCTDKRLPTAGIVILGELSCCNVILEDVFMTRSARKPRETDIYELKRSRDEIAKVDRWTRAYAGAYARRPAFHSSPEADPS